MSGLEPRPYQLESASVAIQRNSIINIRTGGGKTLIAVLVVDHFLNKCCDLKIIFIVPSRALVTQQAAYLRENCANIRTGQQIAVTELCGAEIDGWSQELWSSLIFNSHVIVGTAEIFRRAFIERNFIQPSQFSLLVFDECHNAIGNSPMASILRDCIMRTPEAHRPHILGLTASFDNGSATDRKLVKKRRDLEALFHGTIFSPEVTLGTGVATNEERVLQVSFLLDDFDRFEDPVKIIVSGVFQTFQRRFFEDGEAMKCVNKGWMVFQNLGSEGLRFWLREGIVQQMMAKAASLEKMSDHRCLAIARNIRSGLTAAHQKLKQFSFASETGLPMYSEQCMSLLRLLWQLWKESQDSYAHSQASFDQPFSVLNAPPMMGKFRGIIFVEQIAMTYPVAFIVNSFFAHMKSVNLDHVLSVNFKRMLSLNADDPSSAITFSPQDRADTFTAEEEMAMNKFFFSPRSLPVESPSDSERLMSGGFGVGKTGPSRSCNASVATSSGKFSSDDFWTILPVSGSSSMEDGVRETHLDAFRCGDVPLLVSTNALEEGIDVPDCSFIIRYDAINTTKSHIQGSGRARCKSARVFYFKNDASAECEKARKLENIARDSSLRLSKNALQEELSKMQRRVLLNSRTPLQMGSLYYPFTPSDSPRSPATVFTSTDCGIGSPVKPGNTSSCFSKSSDVTIPSAFSYSDTAVRPSGGGDVHLFNCLTIYYEYVQRVTLQQIHPEVLFEYSYANDKDDDDQLMDVAKAASSVASSSLSGGLDDTDSVDCMAAFPPPRALMSLKLPTPKGLHSLTIDEINAIWGTMKVEDVVYPRDRLKGLGMEEIQRRRAAFCAVVYLHHLGLLGPSNEPTGEALAGGTLIDLSRRNKAAHLKNRYPAESVCYKENFVIDDGV